MNDAMQTFLAQLNQTIGLSTVLVENGIVSQKAYFLLTRQIEDLENTYKKVNRLLECI